MDELPPDPFKNKSDIPDLTTWGLNCRAMYNGLTAAGFKPSEALEFTIRVMTALFLRASNLWVGTVVIMSMCGL